MQLGGYHFKCMSFGFTMSQDIFQMKMDQTVMSQHFMQPWSFTVATDHKSLEIIALKNSTSAPPYLQRMLLHLQQCQAEGWNSPDLHLDHIPISNTILVQLCKETGSCLVWSTVYRLMDYGWPATYRQVPRIA